MPSTFDKVIGNISLSLIGKDLKIQLPQNLGQVIISVIAILPYIILIASIIMVMVGVYHWVKSNGNEKELEKGKKTIINALKGFFVLILFFLISNFISFLLIGLSVSDAFFALAPCGSEGNVIDRYNKKYQVINQFPGFIYIPEREKIYEAFLACFQNINEPQNSAQ